MCTVGTRGPTRSHKPGKKQLCHFQQPSAVNNSSVRGESLCVLPHPCWRIDGLDLCRSCVVTAAVSSTSILRFYFVIYLLIDFVWFYWSFSTSVGTLGTEPSILHLVGKSSIMGLYPQPNIFFIWVFERGVPLCRPCCSGTHTAPPAFASL